MKKVLLTSLVFFSLSAPAFEMASRWVIPSRENARFEMQPQERTRPVVMGDILYFANLSGEVYAVNRTEGYVLWKVKMPRGVDGSLAYARSRVYVGDTDGNFWALEARDGSVAWKFKVATQWLAPAAVVRDRVVAVTSSDEVFALAEGKGNEVWHYSHRGDEKMTVRGTAGTAVYGSDTVVVGFSDGHVAHLDYEGKVKWDRGLRKKARFYDVDATAYIDDELVVTATYDGTVYGLNRASGDTKWSLPAGSYGGFVASGDTLFFAGLNGNFYAVNKQTGEVKWKTPFTNGVGLTPVLSGDYVVFTTSSDPVYVLDKNDGKLVWQGNLGTGSLAGPAAHPDGWVYCLSNFGVLYSFEILPTLDRKKGPETKPVPSALHRNLG